VCQLSNLEAISPWRAASEGRRYAEDPRYANVPAYDLTHRDAINVLFFHDDTFILRTTYRTWPCHSSQGRLSIEIRVDLSGDCGNR
jgi:hypothetical protein